MALLHPTSVVRPATLSRAARPVIRRPAASIKCNAASGGSFFVGAEGRPGPNDGLMSRDLAPLLIKNREWSRKMVEEDPRFFERISNQQAPEYLWIGCADSRVPANVIVGLDPGEVFVQRNVGNQALLKDMNCMACLEFAVKALKVKTIIISGHYDCGAVKAALRWPSSYQGLVNMWISDIREARNQHMQELMPLEPQQQWDRLCELNVMRQVFHVCASSTVQDAWKIGQSLSVYGVIYSTKDGLVKELVGPLKGKNDIDAKQAIFEVFDNQGPIRIANSANPVETKAMAEQLAMHTAWAEQTSA